MVVKPTMSLKKMVTCSYFSGATNEPVFRLSATGLAKPTRNIKS